MALVAMFGGPILAHETGPDTIPDQAKQRQQRSERSDQSEDKSEQGKEQACKRKLRSIKHRGEQVVRHAERHLAVFDKISDRVQTFAEDKGKKPENYTTLLDDVKAKRAIVLVEIARAKEVFADFDCADREHFKSDAKDALKELRGALKDYRRAINQLIVGVKSVNGKTEKENKS